MSDIIAHQLGGLFQELANRKLFSDIVRVDLSAAGASGRLLRLLICQCDTDELELLSFVRRFWVADAAGLRADAEWPLTSDFVQHEGWETIAPFIKFATNGRRVVFGMKFGPNWYIVREGPIRVDGRFVPHELTTVFQSVQ